MPDPTYPLIMSRGHGEPLASQSLMATALTSNLTPAFRRLRDARGAMAVYVSLRVLTCLLPFLHIIPGASSSRAPGYSIELGALVLLLTLLSALPYGVVLGSFLSDDHESSRKRRSLLLIVVVGALDLASALAIVAFTDGWSSQFRHYWSTALLVPCLVLGLRWSMVLAGAWIIVIGLTLNLTWDPLPGQEDNLLYLQVGWAVTNLVAAATIGFLGDIVFKLQRSRRSAEVARDNLETMREITRHTAMITTGMNELMSRMARAIGERHSCQLVGIYVVESGGDEVRLAGWLGESDILRRHERQHEGLVHEAISTMEERLIRDGQTWNAAIPIRDIDSTVGVLLIGLEGTDTDVNRMTVLGHSVAGHIAMGIRVARLRQRLDSAATQQEWEWITRQIHDRISSSFYSLMMYLETHSEQARLKRSPVYGHLESIIPSFAQLMIETRHYMYHFLPALRGEIGLDRVVDSMVAEFERTSEIPVRLTIGGSAANIPTVTTMGVCQVLQHRLSDILLFSGATQVEVSLDMESDNILLSISDDGLEDSTGHLDSIRELAGDMGGRLEVGDARDGNMKMVLDVTIERSGRTLDQPRDT